jgi:hypothetical protein
LSPPSLQAHEAPAPRSASRGVWAFAGIYAVWLVAWVMTTPPFSGADEWAHYLRALGIREGRLIGDRVPEGHAFPGFSPAQESFLRQTSRALDVPPGMSHKGYACNAYHPYESARCFTAVTPLAGPDRDVTVTGAYPPAFYLLPAASMLRATTPISALLRARLINALTCALLLLLAVWVLSEAEPSPPALASFAIGLSPMGLGTMAGLSPSGPEIAAGLTFSAGLCRLAAQGSGSSRAWVACLIGGVALALARPLGTVWVVLHLGIFVVLSGREGLRQLVRHQRSRAWKVGMVLVGAFVLNRVWEFFQGARVPVTLLPGMKAWREAFKHYPVWLEEQVGVFQYLDTPLPQWVYPAWGLLLAALVARQWPRLAPAWRWRACGLALCILAVPLGLYVTVMRNSEFWLQGRYILPMSCALPLLFGTGPLAREGLEAAARGRGFYVALAGGVGVLQALAWFANARRSAVGTQGPWLFFSSAEWHPPLGWLPWATLAVGCAVALPLCVAWVGRTQALRSSRSKAEMRAS